MSQLSLHLPPLSHYLDDPHAATATPTPTPTTPTSKKNSKKGLTRSVTLSSRIKRNLTSVSATSSSSLQRSHSASESPSSPRHHLHPPPPPPPPPPAVWTPIQQEGHWDDTAPWEMYFDPNYTFFGGTVLDPRQRKRQQDVLKAMALNDYHLHLHPPPSAAASTAADQLQQPSLPYTVMDAVHHQHYVDPPWTTTTPTTITDNDNDDVPVVEPPLPMTMMITMEEEGGDDNERAAVVSPTASVQTLYYPAESSPIHGLPRTTMPMHPQEHQSRLALLHAIRTELYPPMMSTAKTSTETMHKSTTPMVQEKTLVPITTSHHHRRYPDPSRYIWMETPSPTQDEKPQSSASTFDLTSFQETGHVLPPPKMTRATLPPPPHPYDTIKKDLTTTTTNTATTATATVPIEKERRYRTSFLYFVFGFLFPPIWVIGALYTPPEHQQAYQSTRGRRIDLMWKRACRMAFGLFTFGLLIMVVVMLALDPGALGWRTSRTDMSSAQQFIPVVSQ